MREESEIRAIFEMLVARSERDPEMFSEWETLQALGWVLGEYDEL